MIGTVYAVNASQGPPTPVVIQHIPESEIPQLTKAEETKVQGMVSNSREGREEMGKRIFNGVVVGILVVALTVSLVIALLAPIRWETALVGVLVVGLIASLAMALIWRRAIVGILVVALTASLAIALPPFLHAPAFPMVGAYRVVDMYRSLINPPCLDDILREDPQIQAFLAEGIVRRGMRYTGVGWEIMLEPLKLRGKGQGRWEMVVFVDINEEKVERIRWHFYPALTMEQLGRAIEIATPAVQKYLDEGYTISDVTPGWWGSEAPTDEPEILASIALVPPPLGDGEFFGLPSGGIFVTVSLTEGKVISIIGLD